MLHLVFRFLLSVMWLAAVLAAPVWATDHEKPAGRPDPSAKTPSAKTPAATGRVVGRVINGTRNRPGPKGLEVRLISLGEKGVTQLGVTKSDASGRFTFSGVKAPEVGKGHLLALTRYLDVPYLALARTGGAETRLRIFELTRDPSKIIVENHQVLVRYEEEGERLVFREAVRLSNTGKATYVAENGETLVFDLPDGAELLQPPVGLNPNSVKVRAGRVSSAEPVPPGFRQVSLVYAVREPPAQLPIEKRIQFRTRRFQVMTTEFRMRQPISTDLKYEGVFGENVADRFHISSKADVSAGARIRYTISRDVKSRFAETLFLAVAAAVVLGLAIPFAIRRRRLARGASAKTGKKEGVKPKAPPAPPAATSRPGSDSGPGAADLARQRSETLRQIGVLDDDREAGRIPEREYYVRRGELKRRALELSKRMAKK